MSSVDTLLSRTCEVHGLTIKRDTPVSRRTFSDFPGAGSESEYWRSRASWYLDVAGFMGLAAVVVLLLDVLFPLPFAVSAAVGVCCAVSVVVVGVWCWRNYSAAMDFAVWSLEAGHES